MNAPIFIVNTLMLICMCTVLLQIKGVRFCKKLNEENSSFDHVCYFQSISSRDYADLHFAITAFLFVFQLIFSFCHLGSQLTAKAAEVNESIYFSKWYNYPPKIQMVVITVMRRAQKPFIITGYSLVSCSLESLKDVSHFIKNTLNIMFETHHNVLLTFQMLNFVTSVFLLLLKFDN